MSESGKALPPCRRCGGAPEEERHWDGWRWSVSVRCPGCGTAARATGQLLEATVDDAHAAWALWGGALRERGDDPGPAGRALRWAALACACTALGALGAWLGPLWGGALMAGAALACAALSCLAAGGADR